MSPYLSHAIAAVGGMILGALGKYLADLWTDRRHSAESAESTKTRFAEAEKLMPELFAEMRADVGGDRSGVIREFYPYRAGSICMPGEVFYYDPAKHLGLPNKLMVLENCGYICNVSSNETDRYRMSEEFVALLRQSKRS